MKNCFVELSNPLKYIFHLSFEKGILQGYMMIAMETLVFRVGYNVLLSNCRPISVLPCFSKILERLP